MGQGGPCRDVERVSVHCVVLIRSALLAPGQTGGLGKFSLNTAHCLNISACQSVTPSPDKSRLVLLNQQWGGSAGRKITRAYFSLSLGRRKPLSTSTSYNCLNYHKNHRRAQPHTCLCSPAGARQDTCGWGGHKIAVCFQLWISTFQSFGWHSISARQPTKISASFIPDERWFVVL